MLFVSLLVLASLRHALAAAAAAAGARLSVNGIEYFVPDWVAGQAADAESIKRLPNALGFTAVTVLDSDVAPDFKSKNSMWDRDDVWQPAFGAHIVSPSNSTLTLRTNCSVPPGPYFLHIYTGNIHRAYRLYTDTASAFTQSLLQLPDESFATLSSDAIAVPSRLYYQQSKLKPLNGVRIGVKDIFALSGAKATYGNRAYFELYPASNTTSPAIQNLISAGAIIVGTQKLSQFANGEIATADWVDYHAPFNPRGDGSYDAASSSAGGGSSIATYEWLDIALGSDTGGSVRGPASVQGVFGNRPSHGIVNLEQVMPLSPALDTLGLLTRHPRLWSKVSEILYEGKFDSEPSKYPIRVVVLDFPQKNTSQGRVLWRFANSLAQFLQANLTKLDLASQWKISGPPEARNQTISQLLDATYTTLITKDQTRLLRDPFFKAYADKNHGRLPFVDPVCNIRWSWGDATAYTTEQALHNKTMFQTWFNSNILPRSASSCSSQILLHTDSTGYFVPRSKYRTPPAPPLGFSNGEISVFSEAPDSVFPIGQLPYHSNVTNQIEYLPVSVDVMVAKGCDALLPRLASDLIDAGILKRPQVGSKLYDAEVA